MAGTQYRGSEITDVDQFVNDKEGLDQSVRRKSVNTLGIVTTLTLCRITTGSPHF